MVGLDVVQSFHIPGGGELERTVDFVETGDQDTRAGLQFLPRFGEPHRAQFRAVGRDADGQRFGRRLLRKGAVGGGDDLGGQRVAVDRKLRPRGQTLRIVRVLVVSQIFLAFGLPMALAPLIWFTSSPKVMGKLTNRPVTSALAIGLFVALVGLNVASFIP